MNGFRVPTHVSITYFNNHAVLLDSRKNSYYALNDSAANFWKFLAQTGSFDVSIKKLWELYQDESDEIEKDMEEVIRSLVKAELLEVE
jgi:hypothetical protein